MAKYNVGDVLEITEDFYLEGAQYSEGEDYTVVESDGIYYSLESDKVYYINTISEVDTHSGFRKVEPKAEFKVGDKVRLLEGAHGNPELGFFWSTEESFETHYGYLYDLAEPFVIRAEIDPEGEVGITQGGRNSYVLPEFLEPWVEDEPVRMELGKTYQSTVNDLFYTPTEFDFEAGRVKFDYKSSPSSIAYKSDRPFYGIEEEFGVLPPVKPENESEQALEELKEKLKPENTLTEVEQEDVGGWDREEFASAATKPETVSVDALREAWDYVDHEYPDIEKLIKLAKRLS